MHALIGREACLHESSGFDVKMFCFSRANKARIKKKAFELKNRQIYFIYLFPRQLKLGKSLQNMLCQFFDD